MKIEKFPVIAPDGTEYRVTIEYDKGTYHCGEWHNPKWIVRLYKRRLGVLFRWKRIYTTAYIASQTDFVMMAERIVSSEYIKNQAGRDATAKKEREVQSALEAFRKWDGKISNNPEVSE